MHVASFIIVVISASVLKVRVSANEVVLIRNASDFVELSESVNNGKSNYSGTTVYLDDDIYFTDELSEQFSPIGSNYLKYFLGTFDGQGHTINGLTMNKIELTTGLFGYSKRITIRNVVIGSSCSYSRVCDVPFYEYIRIGWLIGHCGSGSDTLIENSINMGTIFVNDTSSGGFAEFHIGGLIGRITSGHSTFFRNCVNYGGIYFETNKLSLYAGGIIGYASCEGIIKISNCANYGSIVSKTAYHTYIGGIIGYIDKYLFSIENCLSAGLISKVAFRKGAIVGCVKSLVNITHCFWTNETAVDKASGSNGACVIDSHVITVDEHAVKELNDYAREKRWSKWIFNKKRGNVTFAVDGDGSNSLWTLVGSDIIMLMDLVGDVNNSFSEWFTDSKYETHFTASVIAESETILYGKWCDISVIFDAEGAEVFPEFKGVIYGSTYGKLPRPSKPGYTYVGWSTAEEGLITNETIVVINETHTAHSLWIVNNYTLTLDYGSKSKHKSLVPYNETIVYPGNPSRIGCFFEGWNDTVERMPAHDLTISAIWRINNLFIVIPAVVIIFVVVLMMAIATFLVSRKNRAVDQVNRDLRTPLGKFVINNNEAI